MRLASVEEMNVMSLAELQTIAHKMAVDKGWWENPKSDVECVALMHCELSEAIEAMRAGNPHSEHIAPFSGVEEELADTIIRILDFAGRYNLDINKAVSTKIRFNDGREHKHGKQF